MIEINLWWLLAIVPFLIMPCFVGVLTMLSWVFPLKKPADTSNRFNRIRLWWFWASAIHRFTGYYPEKSRWWIFKEIILRPETFVDIYPWMKGDEVDNMGRFWERRDD